MSENKQGNDENVNSKTYIKKGFWISLGAAAGIGLVGASIMGISELSTFIGNIPVAYKVLTQKIVIIVAVGIVNQPFQQDYKMLMLFFSYVEKIVFVFGSR